MSASFSAKVVCNDVNITMLGKDTFLGNDATLGDNALLGDDATLARTSDFDSKVILMGHEIVKLL